MITGISGTELYPLFRPVVWNLATDCLSCNRKCCSMGLWDGVINHGHRHRNSWPWLNPGGMFCLLILEFLRIRIEVDVAWQSHSSSCWRKPPTKNSIFSVDPGGGKCKALCTRLTAIDHIKEIFCSMFWECIDRLGVKQKVAANLEAHHGMCGRMCVKFWSFSLLMIC